MQQPKKTHQHTHSKPCHRNQFVGMFSLQPTVGIRSPSMLHAVTTHIVQRHRVPSFKPQGQSFPYALMVTPMGSITLHPLPHFSTSINPTRWDGFLAAESRAPPPSPTHLFTRARRGGPLYVSPLQPAFFSPPMGTSFASGSRRKALRRSFPTRCGRWRPWGTAWIGPIHRCFYQI